MGNVFCVVCGCVDQASVGVVERWGRFEKIAEPGFHCFNPLAGQFHAGILSTRISSLDVRIETKTKDNVFVQMLCSIQYRVIKQNADDAFYELQNPKEQIQAYVFDDNFHYLVNSFPIFCVVLVPLLPVFFSLYYNQRHTFLQLSEPMFRK
ncbi:hypothetical protein RHSIM_Rhsim03G0259800 [Rhododendron simsii]|uniref:Band 7 domain-containing protein n=1 Tax=Rhododendron simsii TaxID=118357 RepID=A0A834H663_RHOSS|nr:hypothetical protein RHSIM_Rhsim03G0259800 [Rhododendron simsii]